MKVKFASQVDLYFKWQRKNRRTGSYYSKIGAETLACLDQMIWRYPCQEGSPLPNEWLYLNRFHW